MQRPLTMKIFRYVIAIAVITSAAASNAAAQATGSRAFTAEAAGGILGSAAGATLGLAVSGMDECNNEDLACMIQALGVAGIGSVIGATAGTVIAGKAVKSRPSVVGAFLGSLAGAAAGVGIVHALTEEVNLRLEKPGTIVVYTVTQGLVTALGSRLGAALRR